MSRKDEIDLDRRGLEPSDHLGAGMAQRIQYEVFWKPSRVPGEFLANGCMGLAACLGLSWWTSWLLGPGEGAHETVESWPVSPWGLALLSILLVPPLEEFLFRVLPRVAISYFRPLQQAHWALGVAMALWFAFLHMAPVMGDHPVPQFGAGLVLWFMQWKHGYFAAVALHASYNACLFGLMAYAGSFGTV